MGTTVVATQSEDGTAFGRLAVALDCSPDSHRALSVGAALAGQAEVPMELVLVGAPGLDPDVDRADLEEWAATIPSLEPSLILLQGLDVADVLCEFGRHDVRALCLTTHGRGALTSSVLGSVSAQVAARAARPVVLVGPHVPLDVSPVETIVVGVDPAAANDVLLRVAARWAHTLRAGLHLVAVEEPVGWMLTGAEPVGHRLDAWLDSRASRLDALGIDVRTTVIRVGRPANALVDVAARDGRCLLAVAKGHGRALSATTARIAHRSPAPVVVAGALDL